MHSRTKKIIIPLFYILAMSLVVFYAWNEQRIVRRGGDGPLYRNLMDGQALIRRGFDTSDIRELKENETWYRFRQTPLRVRNSLLPDLPKRAFLSPWGNEAEEFTINIPVDLNEEAITFLNDNPSVLPGAFLGYIGENWEVFFNGIPVRSEIHLDETGKMTEKRTWRSVYFPIDRSYVVSGTNILTLRIIGDPAYLITGLSYNAPHYFDDYSLIQARQHKFLLIALCGIFGFTGIYYLATFLLLRRRAEIFNLYFSAFSILLCVYAAMRHGLLRAVIPNSDVTMRLEFGVLMIISSVFFMFIENLGRGRVIKPTWAFFFFCLYLSLSQLFFCAQYGEEIIWVWDVAVIAYLAFVIFYDIIYFYLFDKNRDRANSEVSESLIINIITGTAAIFICGAYEAVDILFFHHSYSLFPYSCFVVHIGMNFALAGRFSGMYKKLEQSNVILENTVKDRTRELEKQTAIAVKALHYKSELFTEMNHEMRTPLTVMSTYAQLTMKRLRASGVDEQTIADLAIISNEAKRLAEMADGTLKILIASDASGVSETDSGGAQINEPVDIGAVCLQLVKLLEPLASRKGMKLRAVIRDNIPSIPVDADGLTQLMWNLLQNAITHSESKTIELTVEASAASPGVTITVNDDGTGIEPEILPRIFERGVSGKKGGSGFGLAICRDIANRHGGDVNIESISGMGTKVTVTLHGIAEKGE